MENQCSQIMIFRRQLKKRLSPMRFEHSLSVSFTCMALAMRYGYDMDKAELAGLLHDCGKRFSDDIILKKCLKHGLNLTEADLNALPTLHALYGAWLAEHKYMVDDPEILDAIRCHTTGKPAMTTLDKILYIADYIEPRRYKADNLADMRRLAFQDLDQTMYEILKGTLEYLQKKGGNIHPLTGEAYRYFKDLISEKKGDLDESV